MRPGFSIAIRASGKFSVSLKDRFLEPLDVSGLTKFREKLSGTVVVDFKRL